MVCEGVDWIYLSQDWMKYRPFVSTQWTFGFRKARKFIYNLSNFVSFEKDHRVYTKLVVSARLYFLI